MIIWVYVLSYVYTKLPTDLSNAVDTQVWFDTWNKNVVLDYYQFNGKHSTSTQDDNTR